MIHTDRHDGIHILRLAHGKANAWDVELMQALSQELKAAHDARAVIITATGSIFCAGVDLHRVLAGGPEYVEQFFPLLAGVVGELFELPLPVIVALNGHAIAGGAILAMAADYKLMAAGKGRFGIPELAVGVPFPAIPLEIVRFAVPPDRIQSLIYTANTLLPEEALAQGLVDEVVDVERLMPRALELAGQFATIDPRAFRAAKLGLRGETIRRMKEEAARTDEERKAVWASAETHSRIRAYLAALK